VEVESQLEMESTGQLFRVNKNLLRDKANKQRNELLKAKLCKPTRSITIASKTSSSSSVNNITAVVEVVEARATKATQPAP